VIRVVLAALLTVGLLGASLPALDDARTERTATLLDGELADVADAAVDLASTEEPAGRPAAAARRTVTVDVPTGGLTTAPATVAVGGIPGEPAATGADVLAYRVAGSVHVRDVPVAIRIAGTEDSPDRLTLSGPRRLVLTLLQEDGRPVVVVRDDGPAAG